MGLFYAAQIGVVSHKTIHTCGPKQYKLLTTYQKIVLIVLKPANEIHLTNLKYQSSTITLSVAIKYSVRDLLCDVNNNAYPQSSDIYASHAVNDVSAPSGTGISSRL